MDQSKKAKEPKFKPNTGVRVIAGEHKGKTGNVTDGRREEEDGDYYEIWFDKTVAGNPIPPKAYIHEAHLEKMILA